MMLASKEADSASSATGFGSETSQPAPAPPEQARASWRCLLAFTTRAHCHVLLAAVVASLAAAALQTVLAVFLGRIFDVVAELGNGSRSGHDALQAVSRWCLLLLGLGFANWLANTAFLALWVTFGEMQADSARRKVFQSLLTRDMSWFDMLEQGVSGLLSRIQTQTRELQSATAQILGFLVCDALASIASLAIALYYSWKMTLVLLATLPVAVAALSLATRRLEPAIQAQKAHLERATKLATASLAAIDVVKVFNGSGRELRQYCAALGLARSHYLLQAGCNSFQMGIVAFWVVAMFVLGFWYGIGLVRDGLPPGHVITTFYSVLAAFQGIEALVPHWLVLSKGMSAGSFLSRIAKRPAVEADGHASRFRLEHCVGDVQFTDVSFAYPSNPAKMVLKRSSFAFPAGQTTFVVGRSGSGKSTVGSLLVNFYRPLAGRIFIDGQPLELLDADWVRENVTLIQQQSVLFSDSLYNNVALGHPPPDAATDEQVHAACQAALLQSTVAGLPRGLHTKVGPGGFDLSGGQKQRVALARARLRNPTVLILDEVTSGLDQVSLSLVMDAIREWRKDKTTIIITHDVSCIDDDDYVYVMDDASVAREGFKRDLDGLRLPSAIADDTPSGCNTDGAGSTGMEAATASPAAPRASSVSEAYHGSLLQHARPGKRMSFGMGAAHALQMRAHGILERPATAPRSASSERAAYHGEPEKQRFSSFARRAPSGGREDRRRVAPPRQPSRESKARAATPMFVFGAAHRREGISRLRRATHEIGAGAAEQQQDSPGAGEAVAKHASLSSILSTVWPALGRGERLTLVLGLVVCLVGAAATPAFAYCLSQLMGVMWSSGDKTAEGRKWAVYLVAVAVADGLGTGGGRYLLELVGQAWVDRIRSEALGRILQQPRPWFDQTSHAPGRVAECLERSAEEMRNVVGRIVPILVFVAAIMSVSVAWALAVSWRLTLVALAPLPLVAAAVRGYAAASSKWERRCNEGAEDTSALATEALVNVRVVAALGLAAHLERRHGASAARTLSLGLGRARHTSWLFGLYQSTSYGLTALVFYYGTRLLAAAPGVDVTAVLQVITLLLFGIGTSSEMLGGIPQLTLAQAAAGPLLAYAALPRPDERRRAPTLKLRCPLPVRMAGAAFSYPGRGPEPPALVLRGLSMEIAPGRCTAIVGPSGCGKSTVLSLLLGLYEPSPLPPPPPVPLRAMETPPPPLRAIKEPPPPPLSFAGVASADVDMQHLRSMTALVPQSPFIFPATIADNILYGLADNSPDRHGASLVRAAQAAGLHDFVASLPQGYATLVGDGGQALSGGQAQRLAIARALVRRPRLLVMDEPTSALDAEDSRTVRRTMERLVRGARGRGGEGMAVVLATHSRDMMQAADRIVVLGDGVDVEAGSYPELVRSGGPFAHLVTGGRWMGGGGGGGGRRDRRRQG